MRKKDAKLMQAMELFIFKNDNMFNRSFGCLNEAELNVFVVLCCEVREKDPSVKIPYDPEDRPVNPDFIPEYPEFKFEDVAKKADMVYTKDDAVFFADFIWDTLNKVMPNPYFYPFGEKSEGSTAIIGGYKVNNEKEFVSIYINTQLRWIFNILTRDMNELELNNFMSLENKYAKLLYLDALWDRTSNIVTYESEALFYKKYGVEEKDQNKETIKAVAQTALEEMKKKGICQKLQIAIGDTTGEYRDKFSIYP